MSFLLQKCKDAESWRRILSFEKDLEGLINMFGVSVATGSPPGINRWHT